MFLESAIAIFLLGVVLGAWLVQIFKADPLFDQNQALKQQQADRSWEREKEALQYEAFVNTHCGTPYISPPATTLEKLLAGERPVRDALDDNDRWSVKATDLKVVS